MPPALRGMLRTRALTMYGSACGLRRPRARSDLVIHERGESEAALDLLEGVAEHLPSLQQRHLQQRLQRKTRDNEKSRNHQVFRTQQKKPTHPSPEEASEPQRRHIYSTIFGRPLLKLPLLLTGKTLCQTQATKKSFPVVLSGPPRE